jgi:hypothetical protein
MAQPDNRYNDARDTPEYWATQGGLSVEDIRAAEKKMGKPFGRIRADDLERVAADLETDAAKEMARMAMLERLKNEPPTERPAQARAAVKVVVDALKDEAELQSKMAAAQRRSAAAKQQVDSELDKLIG